MKFRRLANHRVACVRAIRGSRDKELVNGGQVAGKRRVGGGEVAGKWATKCLTLLGVACPLLSY